MQHKLKVLFLCTGNSCRSQMAEGWARALHPQALDARSAGIYAHGQNPHALKVMAEAGVDISVQPSQSLADLNATEPQWQPEVVFTVCGHAHETCPHFPGAARVIHHGFDDPPRLAEGLSGEAELAVYRRVRDEIRAWVAQLPQELAQEANNDRAATHDTRTRRCCIPPPWSLRALPDALGHPLHHRGDHPRPLCPWAGA